MTGHRCSIGLMFKFAAYLLLIGGGLLCLNETKKQYNKELDEAVARIEKGNFVSHKDALKELSKW